jgi:hypothetical protein
MVGVWYKFVNFGAGSEGNQQPQIQSQLFLKPRAMGCSLGSRVESLRFRVWFVRFFEPLPLHDVISHTRCIVIFH